MIHEGTEYFEFWVSRIPPQTPPAGRIQNLAEFQKHSAEEKRKPNPQNICSAFLSPYLYYIPALFIFEKLCALHRGA